MLASQDIAVPEPGVCIDDFRRIRKPVHRPCWTTALICSATCDRAQPLATPEAHTSHLHASSRVPQLPVTQSCAFRFLGAVYLSREWIDKIGSIHNSRGIEMEYDKDKVDDMVLALMYLGMFSERSVQRAWKSFDWDALDRLHEKGYISNPKSAAKSVAVSDSGAKLAESLFKKHFGIVDQR